jgi:ABC-type bacteriocin/lantibiotic exporter with double-glycine peptidase domain
MVLSPAVHERDTKILSAVIGVAILSAGCVSPISRSVDQEWIVDSGRYRLVAGVSVPEVRGVEGCGAQALAAVLAFEDPRLDAGTLAEELPWHDQGATPVDLLLAARHRGFTARIARGSWENLEDSLRAGRPVVVMFDAAPAMWTSGSRIQIRKIMHWSVVSGIAEDGSAVLLAGRRERVHVVRRDDFLRRWARSDCCLIVVERPAAAGT